MCTACAILIEKISAMRKELIDKEFSALFSTAHTYLTTPLSKIKDQKEAFKKEF